MIQARPSSIYTALNQDEPGINPSLAEIWNEARLSQLTQQRQKHKLGLTSLEYELNRS